MSTSSRSRGPRSGGKGAPVKKGKKPKSDFKTSRKRLAAAEQVDLEQVRTRTLDALGHLGHQKFSTEPGGYDLKGWLKSLKTLLDDSEKKLGDALTSEYHDKRKEVEIQFSKPADTSKLDEEIEAIRNEEGEIRAKITEETERISSRLGAIGNDKVSRSKELDEHKLKLKNAQEEKKSASFFSRLMGRGGPSTEPMEKKVEDLEKGLKMLEEEALNLQTVRKSLEGKQTEVGLHDGLWTRLESLGERLKELEVAKQVKQQLAVEREAAAAGLGKIISEIKFEAKKEE